MNPLELRKQLLIAESELNRAQLVEEWDAATEWHRTLSAGAKTVGSMASAAALLMSGIRAFRRKRDAQNGTAISWLQPLITGAGLISTLCEKFRARNGEQKNQRKKPER